MDPVVLYCKKCDYVTFSFDRLDDYAFTKALNRIKSHMEKEHPRVRNIYRNYDWRRSGDTPT